MSQFAIHSREMTPSEFEQMKSGFDRHTLEHGIAVQRADRYTKVAEMDLEFAGCASGLAYFNKNQYANWFYLTDLFIEKTYRRQGLGRTLLRSLEEEVAALGIKNIWTWTAGYEAPGFYRKSGYKLFMEMPEWYSDGSSRLGVCKLLGD